MQNIINDLYPLNRCQLGEGYDNALLYLEKLIDLEVLEFTSGMKLEQWTVPEEWVVRDAWVKYKGKKIIDYQKNPLSLMVGSLPFNGKVSLEELLLHLHYSDAKVDAHICEEKYYEKDWGLTMPKSKIYKLEGGKNVGMKLKEGEYEVFIDTEYRPGVMKVATHTIKGKTDKEILLFAHLDGPFQANDNLSGVACLVDLVKHIKPEQYEHTIKLIFCPKIIGSIAYATTQDISRVDAVFAVNAVGTESVEGILFQKSFKDSALNTSAHLAIKGMGEGYRQGIFRSALGGDEYVFNDPQLDIPAILISTHYYPEYHTSADTPEIIDYPTIEKVQRFLLKTIEYYEKDFILERQFTGPLFRSKYGFQSKGQGFNLSWDHFIYSIDGRKTLGELCLEYGLNFEYTLDRIEILIADGQITRRPTPCEE